jgi:hypothetical protein
VTRLERAALDWIEPYWNAHHLVRTRDWVLELEPTAAEALRLAALTHDIERHYPGGPVDDLTRPPEETMDYRRAHSERSAAIVGEWLGEQGAEPMLITQVEELVRLHETGGTGAADVLQAADSLSFLEVNVPVTLAWIAGGRCDADRARDQHRWMYERIRLASAKELARPYYERAIAAHEEAAARA